MPGSEIQDLARTRGYGSETVARWLALDETGQRALLAVAARLRPSENHLRDFLDAAVEIGSRRGCSAGEVLDDPAVRQTLARELPRNDAVKALKRTLRRLRYPQLSAAEERLRLLIRELALPSSVRVEFPEDLEGEHLTVTLRAGSVAELRAQLEALSAAVRGGGVEEMFRQLEGDW